MGGGGGGGASKKCEGAGTPCSPPLFYTNLYSVPLLDELLLITVIKVRFVNEKIIMKKIHLARIHTAYFKLTCQFSPLPHFKKVPTPVGIYLKDRSHEYLHDSYIIL